MTEPQLRPSVSRLQAPVSCELAAWQAPPAQVHVVRVRVRVPRSSQVEVNPPHAPHAPRAVVPQDSPSVVRVQLSCSWTAWSPEQPLAVQTWVVRVRVRVPVVAQGEGQSQGLQGLTWGAPHALPSGLAVQDSDSVEAVSSQVPPAQAERVTLRVRVPCPLQSAPRMQGLHAPSWRGLHASPSSAKPSDGQSREAPSHVSATSHVPLLSRQPVPAGLGEQVPTAPSAVQVSQARSQAALQQVPSTHVPERHSVLPLQGEPSSSFGVQAPSAQ